MKNTPTSLTARYIWVIGLLVTLAVIIVPLVILWPKVAAARDNPQAHLPEHPIHTSHADLLPGPYATGQEVTAACLECHPDSAQQLMGTTHWTWESEPVEVPWRDEPVTIGKKNQINNFCISSQGNEKKCMSCHAGYGWEDNTFDFNEPTNVDCLVCHADMATYGKGDFGNPTESVDLAAAAQSVRAPTRENCGTCHFNGGGGNGVKHGDLDESLYFPPESLDVHMGSQDLICTDCHWTEDHVILGRLLADNYIIPADEQVACTNCHSDAPHEDERVNAHLQTVACQTCHIPSFAMDNPTKMFWDWSTSGQDIPEDHYTYLKIKGSFLYEENVSPTYTWFNGSVAYRYLLGDPIDPTQPTVLNPPAGSIDDATARIFPFKVHVGRQPYDVVYNYLLAPITAGENGYWTNFDWDNAFRLAEEITGLPYSGQYGFAETWMYWPTSHLVQPAEDALQCEACHDPNGRLDWEALGYPGDPMEWGGRFQDK